MKISVGIDGGKTTYHACAIDGDGEFCDAPGWVVNRMSGVFRGAAKSMHRARRGLARDIDKLIRDRFRSHPQVEIIAPLLALASSLVDVLWMLLRDGRTFVPATPTPITSAA